MKLASRERENTTRAPRGMFKNRKNKKKGRPGRSRMRFGACGADPGATAAAAALSRLLLYHLLQSCCPELSNTRCPLHLLFDITLDFTPAVSQGPGAQLLFAPSVPSLSGTFGFTCLTRDCPQLLSWTWTLYPFCYSVQYTITIASFDDASAPTQLPDRITKDVLH